jgi:hypothetical protein
LPVAGGGSIFIEYVFSYPGMGVLFITSALPPDITMMLAITVLTTLITIRYRQPACRYRLCRARPEGAVQLIALVLRLAG